MPKVVAKFVCREVEPYGKAGETGHKPHERVRLGAAEQQNSEWAAGHPYGVIDMLISNPGAFGSFKPGDEVMVTLDVVAKPVTAAAALGGLVDNKKAA